MRSEPRLSGDPDRSNASRNVFIATFVVLAIAAWAASFMLSAPPRRVVGAGQFGPVSMSSGNVVDIPAPAGLDTPRPRSIDLQFQFRVSQFVTYENLFRTGPGNLGLRAEMSPDESGQRSVILVTQLSDGTLFSPVLVNHVVTGRTYLVHIMIDRGGRITAWLDGRMQFTFSYTNPIVEPVLSPVTVGAGYNLTRPFDGAVSGFTLSYRQFAGSGPDTAVVALQVTAALLLAVALVLFLLRISTSEPVARWSAEHFAGRLAAVGLLLVVTGTALLAVITPPENAVLQQSGQQTIRSAGVSPGQETSYNLAGAPQLFTRADALDVSLSFDMRLDASPPAVGQFSSVVVSEFGVDQGVAVLLLPSGELEGLIGQRGGAVPITVPLANRFPRNQWVSVQVIVKRSQSAQFLVNGQQVWAYTWARPSMNVTPPVLLVGGDTAGTFGGSVTNLQSNVVLYRQPPTRTVYVLVRSGQVLAVLAIAFGFILLARRFLSRLIPVATGVHRALVLTVFGTAGIGIVANVLVDQLRAQQSPGPFIQRNAWLFEPDVRFSDFLQVFEIFKSLNPYGLQGNSYPPVGYWLVAPVSWMSQYAGLFVFLAICGGFLLWWFARSFTSGLPRGEGVLVMAIAILSLPVTFAFDRANIDLLVFVMVVAGVAALERKRGALAASWLGAAAAAKIIPGLYLFLLFRGRRWRFLFLGLAVVLGATLLATLGFHGTLRQNFDGFRSGLSAVEQGGGTIGSTYYNASLAGCAQGVGLAIAGTPGVHVVWRAIEPLVTYLEIVGVSLLAWYLRWRERSLWRAVTLITVVLLLLPVISYYYELLFLFVPVGLFVRQGAVNRRTLRIACLFGLLLAPKAYFYLANSQVDSSVLLTAPLLIALAVAVIRDGYCERRASTLGDDQESSISQAGASACMIDPLTPTARPTSDISRP